MRRDRFGFQGLSTRGYFEGWYFKNVAPAPAESGTAEAYSFIPGIAYDKAGNGHAFVQTIRGADGATAYTRYSVEDFRPEPEGFGVQVGPNYFSFGGIEISLPEAFDGISGSLRYGEPSRIPATPLRPGIMGWYRYVPGMECYHGLGSMDHVIGGSLKLGSRKLSFTGGRGYLEKDWGTSMPSSWIWMQTNSFARPGTSFMLSLARVPWMGRSFPGFLGFVNTPELRSPLQFGTYSGAKVRDLHVADHHVSLTVTMGSLRLEVEGTRSHTGSLQAPVAGGMDRRISESLDGRIQLRLYRAAADGSVRHVLFSGTGSSAGIEVVGDTAELA